MKNNSFIDRLSKGTEALEKNPYIMFMIVVWMIYMASKQSAAWKFPSFLAAVGVLVALFCFFFYLKLMLSNIPRKQERLYKRIGAVMKLCLHIDFILTVILTGFFFEIKLICHYSVAQQIFFWLSFLAQVLFVHLFLATLYSLSPSHKAGLKWVLGASTVILFIAIIATFDFIPFAKYIAYFWPFIGLFYMYLENVTFFIWGTVAFIILLCIAFIFIIDKRYKKTHILNTIISAMRHVIKLDWIFAVLVVVACISLFIFDKEVTHWIAYASIAVVLCYIVLRGYMMFKKRSFKDIRFKKLFPKKKKSTLKKIKVKKLR